MSQEGGAGQELVLSVEETNDLRKKLGLAPLRIKKTSETNKNSQNKGIEDAHASLELTEELNKTDGIKGENNKKSIEKNAKLVDVNVRKSSNKQKSINETKTFVNPFLFIYFNLLFSLLFSFLI